MKTILVDPVRGRGTLRALATSNGVDAVDKKFLDVNL